MSISFKVCQTTYFKDKLSIKKKTEGNEEEQHKLKPELNNKQWWHSLLLSVLRRIISYTQRKKLFLMWLSEADLLQFFQQMYLPWCPLSSLCFSKSRHWGLLWTYGVWTLQMLFFFANVLGSSDLRSYWQEVTICLFLLDDQKGAFLAPLPHQNNKGS